MRKRRKGCGSPKESISFSSSDSDDGTACKSSRCKKGKGLRWPCMSLGKRVGSCMERIKCGMSCMCLQNLRCLLPYLMIILVPLLLYMFGPYIWRLVKRILPPSLFKSTTTIVDEALARYNADKLGLADYALESAGGSILCSSNTYYSRDGALYSIFGIPLWYHSSSPREVIQPDVQPGKCWAMDGSRGYVMVQLSMPIIVTAISLEHIPAQVAPLGRVDSAPKDFSIVGKEKDMDSPYIGLGNFHFNPETGSSIQSFAIKDPICIRQTTNYAECPSNRNVFRIIELRVLSNHGNRDYTCIYRLRVHGRPLVQSLADQEYDGEKINVP